MESGVILFTVTDFSSENSENPAENLANQSKQNNGWKGSAAGSEREFVIVELNKPSALRAVKVTNNFSGLLEVQASRNEEKWEIVVAKSSLMTPLDSRATKNGHVQRDLILKPETSNFLWKKLKFVCQQPFNKEIFYGLRNIQIEGSSGPSKDVGKSEKKSGEIVLKKKEKSGEALGAGSLFVSAIGKQTLPPPNKQPTNKPTKEEEEEEKGKGKESPSGVDSLQPKNEEDEETLEPSKMKPSKMKPSTLKLSSAKVSKTVSRDDDRVAAADRPLRVRKKEKEASDEEKEEEEEKPSTSKSTSKPKSETKNGSKKNASLKKSSVSKTEPKRKRKRNSTSDEEEDEEEDEDEEEEEEEKKGKSGRKGGSKKGADGKTSNGKTSKGKKSKKGKSPTKKSVKRKKASESEEEDAEEEDEDEDEDEEEESRSKKPAAGRKGAKSESLKEIMNGCVLALSGFVNPVRGELRDKALQMGAKYKSDWSAECTHLVCAFPNTPKFNQVRTAGGRIVKKEWLLDCFENKRLIPWRTYMLKPKMDSQNVEDEDELEEEAKFNEDEEWEPDAGESSGGEEGDDDEDDSVSEVLSEEFSESEKSLAEDEEDEEGGVTDEEMDESEIPLTPPKKQAKKTAAKKRRGVRFSETDSEEEMNELNELNELNLTDSEEADIPEEDFVPRKRPLFRNMKFFFYGDFEEMEKKKLKKTTEELAGTVKNTNDEMITHCVTNADWSTEFEEALKENPGLMIVKPEWIFECAEKRELLDARKFKPSKTT